MCFGLCVSSIDCSHQGPVKISSLIQIAFNAKMEVRLRALSPLDGRYASIVENIRNNLSECAYIQKRAAILTEWLLWLSSAKLLESARNGESPLPSLSLEEETRVRKAGNFSLEDVLRVKEAERLTNHDLKAIEYALAEKLEKENLQRLKSFLHFGCTSEDVNNCAYSLLFKNVIYCCLLPVMEDLIKVLENLVYQNSNTSLLARTHGQPATPTTFGKEMANFVWRLRTALRKCETVKFQAKFNGAVGCFNALLIAYPSVDWPLVARHFVEDKLGLTYLPYSTQIDQHDWLAELCDALARFNTILLDLNVDIWLYISRGLLKLKTVAEEVGSSTMPHKVNPIDFENAEGNLHVANALLRLFSAKLPISRLQRDLSDSTVLRNVGVALGHCLVAYTFSVKGLLKIDVNKEEITRELNLHWEVLAEPVQTLLRKAGVEDAYEQLKCCTRGESTSSEKIKEIIKDCFARNKVSERIAADLDQLTPYTYTGLAAQLATSVLDRGEKEAAEQI